MPFSADSAATRNPFPTRKYAALALAACGVFALSGCSSSKKLSQEQSCQEKWDKAKPKFDKQKYVQAKELLSELVTSCPGSVFTEEAMFDLAETKYHLKDWEDAEQEYSSFLKDFPASKRFGELAHYRSAEVTGNQVEIPSRDQTKTLDAIAAYESFLDEYPDGARADSAKVQLDKLHDLLAEKQMQVAHLYMRMGEPLAAAIYYKNLLKEYGTRVNQRDINLKLAHCYIELDQFEEAETYLGKFDGIAKDDPFKEQVKQAYKDLDKARTKLAKEKKDEQEQGKRQEAM